ncbi:SDR family NAD(P)-dependent oxidoreductase [Nostoc sp.]|uniref:SDR family NAD(P)-dependent oxidoreductase n=1 Tax=Nostoc sp. TaxID=1180 RepID=UPI002FFD1634
MRIQTSSTDEFCSFYHVGVASHERESPDLFIQSDISTPDGIEKVVKEVLARLGGVDILINNVGGSSAPSGGALALTDDDWQQIFNANLFAAVRLDRAFLPKMLEQGSGVIIHISSIQRTLPLYDATLAYAAAKAALTNYSKRQNVWPSRPSRRGTAIDAIKHPKILMDCPLKSSMATYRRAFGRIRCGRRGESCTKLYMTYPKSSKFLIIKEFSF